MIGNLFILSKDHDKVRDCKFAAVHTSKNKCVSELLNIGYSFLYDNEPYIALDAFLKVAQDYPKFRRYAYDAIAIVYMYLRNFR